MRKILFAFLLLPTSLIAQDDDMYFVPEKPAANKIDNNKDYQLDNENYGIVDYHSSSRNEDEYNRMSNYADDELDKKDTEGYETDYDVEDDYTYSRRIIRFRSPHVGVAISSPFYWDLVYNYGVYDYIYDSYYDPFFWGYGWRYGWSWGPWHSWYGPIWGWSSPHHWYHWGCGPLWGGGFHGHHHFIPYKHYKRGTFTNRFGSGERIRTGISNERASAGRQNILASRTSALDRNNTVPQRNKRTSTRTSSRTGSQKEEGTYTRYQRSRSSESNNYRGQTPSRSQRSSEYTRPSSSRYNKNRTETTTQKKESRVSRPSSNSSSRSSGVSRSTSSSSRSSFSTGSSRSSGSFGGGSSRGGGGGRR